MVVRRKQWANVARYVLWYREHYACFYKSHALSSVRVDVWNSRTILGDGANESLLDAFQNKKRIVFEFYNVVGFGGKNCVVAKALGDEFTKMWNEAVTGESAPHVMRAFLLPKMRYCRTFRCSKRALEYFGPSLGYEFEKASEEYQIEPSVVGKIIEDLAKRSECMIVLAFKSFRSDKSQCGNALIIDCVPTLESLEGPNFQQSDVEFFSDRDLITMLDLLSLSKGSPQQLEQARDELHESFTFKFLRTYSEFPGYPAPTVGSKKLVRVPVHVIRTDEEAPVAVETVKLPHGAIALARVDTKFCFEMLESFSQSRHGDWVKLRPWICGACGASSASKLVVSFPANADTSMPMDAPIRVYIFPVCDDENCALLQRQVIDKAMKAASKVHKSQGSSSMSLKYCEHCRKYEPNDGPLFSKCSRCKTVTYCSKECQRKHWKVHRKVCQAPPKFKIRLDPNEFEQGAK